MKTHFLTFGTGYWKESVDLLCKEVEETKLFDIIHPLSEKDIGDYEKEFISQNPKGYGLWIWKPYICKKIMDEADDGDIFVYADAGCVINPKGLKRIKEYFEILNSSEKGVIGFETKNKYAIHKERVWNKRELLKLFNFDTDSTILESAQIEATAFAWKKCKHSQMIFDRWKEISQNKIYINNELTIEQDPEFKEHRWDQSIFSLLLKTHGCELLGWETWCWSHFYNGGIDYNHFPIWEMRRGKRN